MKEKLLFGKKRRPRRPEPFKPMSNRRKMPSSLMPTAARSKLSRSCGSSSGLRSEPAYGHTPGHTFYVLEDGGQKIVFVGDLIHIPSAQFDDPDVAMKFDFDAAQAIEVRKHLLADAAKNGYEIAGAHLPFPGLWSY
ncbi:unnamed protein product [Sphagnum jensenii]